MARWYDVPKVERSISLSDLIKTMQLMGSYGVTFAAIGEVFALTNHVVEKFRHKDFCNGAMGGFVVGTSILGFRGRESTCSKALFFLGKILLNSIIVLIINYLY